MILCGGSGNGSAAIGELPHPAASGLNCRRKKRTYHFTMCGRYTLNKTARQLGQTFSAHLSRNMPERFERFNIAPSQPIPVVRMGHGGPERTMLRWGLVPHFDDAGYSMGRPL